MDQEKILEIIAERDEGKYKDYVRDMMLIEPTAKDIVYFNHLIGARVSELTKIKSDLEMLLIIKFVNDMSIWYMDEFKDTHIKHIKETFPDMDSIKVHEETVVAIKDISEKYQEAIDLELEMSTNGNA